MVWQEQRLAQTHVVSKDSAIAGIARPHADEGDDDDDDDDDNSDNELPGAYAMNLTRVQETPQDSTNDAVEWDPTEPISSADEHRRARPRGSRAFNADEESVDDSPNYIDANVEVNNTITRRRWPLLLAVALIWLGAFGAIVGVLMSGGGGKIEPADVDSQPEDDRDAVLTRDECYLPSDIIDSDPFLQCKCGHQIVLTNSKVEAIYNDLRGIYSEQLEDDMTFVSCDMENIALAWAALNSFTAKEAGETVSATNTENRFFLSLLYASWGGDEWRNTENWLRDGVTECDWYGVGCDDDGKITSLSLPGNNLQGELGTHFGLLEDLKALDLRFNDLSGSIPSEALSRLTHLEDLSLGVNFLTGTFPTSYVPSSNLKKFSIFGNFISGKIPSLSGWSNLVELNLNRTNLSGSIPNEWGSLSRLEILDMEIMRYLNGKLPPSFGTWTSLKMLNLNHTAVSGTIPESIGNLVTLETLKAGYSLLSGSIPSSVGNLTNLVTFDVEQGDLSGTIPSELARCTGLKVFNVRNNEKMTGTLPVELEELEDLESLDIWLTGINGTVPSGICDHGHGKEVVTTNIESPGCACCKLSSNGADLVPP
mmetsp:Transcript_7085/g.11756  ORF Transcript_7085/g.11756 Transcript_7085/m.11756 type:complete len:595 (+) Transcript_7085:14-1798(+)